VQEKRATKRLAGRARERKDYGQDYRRTSISLDPLNLPHLRRQRKTPARKDGGNSGARERRRQKKTTREKNQKDRLLGSLEHLLISTVSEVWEQRNTKPSHRARRRKLGKGTNEEPVGGGANFNRISHLEKAPLIYHTCNAKSPSRKGKNGSREVSRSEKKKEVRNAHRGLLTCFTPRISNANPRSSITNSLSSPNQKRTQNARKTEAHRRTVNIGGGARHNRQTGGPQ